MDVAAVIKGSVPVMAHSPCANASRDRFLSWAAEAE